MDNTNFTHVECVRCKKCFNYDECKEKGCLIWCAYALDCDIENHERPCCIKCGAYLLEKKENE